MALNANILIRPMTVEDYTQVHELWSSVEGLHLSDNDSRPNISRYLLRNPGLSLVALDSQKLCGAILCGHDGRWGILRHLAVDNAYRRRGIGRNLVDGCLSNLKAAGYTSAVALVTTGNNQALRFWIANGWKQYNSFPLGKDIL
jgi:N-acetylglutamate synthase